MSSEHAFFSFKVTPARSRSFYFCLFSFVVGQVSLFLNLMACIDGMVCYERHINIPFVIRGN